MGESAEREVRTVREQAANTIRQQKEQEERNTIRLQKEQEERTVREQAANTIRMCPGFFHCLFFWSRSRTGRKDRY